MNVYLKLLLAMLIVASLREARATAIVVIYTSDGLWLAADGYRSGSGKRLSEVCKIHETQFGLLLKAGESQGTRLSETQYSTDREVEDEIPLSTTQADFKINLRRIFKRDVEEEMVFLLDNPRISFLNLETSKINSGITANFVGSLTRIVILVDISGSKAEGRVLEIIPESDQRTDGRKTYFTYWARAVLGWHTLENAGKYITAPASVHQFAYATSYMRTNEWVQAHPELAIRELLDKASSEQPNSIGPPYSIVHVVNVEGGAPTIHWVSEGQCPGWTETTYSQDTLVDMRNDYRRTSREAQRFRGVSESSPVNEHPLSFAIPRWASQFNSVILESSGAPLHAQP